jgi:hypothetical protein
MEALVYRTLAEHDPKAAPLAQQHATLALDLRPSKGRERSSVFDHLSLASASWIAGQPDEAQMQAKMALALIRDTSSYRTWDRLREMYRLTHRYKGMPEVADLREQIRLALPRQKQIV